MEPTSHANPTCPCCGVEIPYSVIGSGSLMHPERSDCHFAGYYFLAEQWARRPLPIVIEAAAPAAPVVSKAHEGGTAPADEKRVTDAEAAYLLGVCYDSNDERDPIIKRIANKLGLGASE